MPAKPDRVPIQFRCKDAAERERFDRAAEKEGFNNLTAWMLFHLRAQVKKTLGDDDQNSKGK